jgi:serine/threonine-protein kinase
MVGQTVSHYRVLEELGGGAMGVVYKAQDVRLKRFVALKFLPPALTRDPAARQRFVQEAEAASALDHPNVCAIHDIDTTDEGRVFIAMAFYEGETLKKRLQRGPLPIAEAVALGAQIARGLAAAHVAGIVHRDIKPANLMLTARGEVKIVDFGIAKLAGQDDLTATGVSLGTVAYMAPEQFAGQIDARVDIWALGVVLFEMLAGRRPFDGENDIAVMNAVLNGTAPSVRSLRPDVPAGLAAIVDRALERRPADRYDSADDVARELETLERPASVSSSREPETGVILRALRRPRVAVPLVGALSVAGFFVTTTVVDARRARGARAEAIPPNAELLDRDE